jgi:hypothetical protein
MMTQDRSAPKLIPGDHVRKSPYFAATERYGCRAYITYNHMYMPLVYETTVAGHVPPALPVA